MINDLSVAKKKPNPKYKVTLSGKIEIPIDPDELSSVINAIGTGDIVRVRGGIFNPAFFVSITEDESRPPINHVYDGLLERPNLPDIFEGTLGNKQLK